MFKSLVQLGSELKQDLISFRQARKLLLPAVCPRCHCLKSNALDREAVDKIGMCLSCEHLLIDYIDPNPYD